MIDKVQEIFRDVFDDDDLVISEKTNSSMIEEWDSMAQVNILMAIELEFDIKFSLDDAQKLKSVGDILTVLSESSHSP